MRDEDKNTALHLAAESGSVDMIKFFWIKECLLTWPTVMNSHRYIFMLN
jgi:hypothetical protein